ncbi:tRNA (adenosine(37)-N6)-threonylcarbamoyltransferase complex dimerization subunit type 1 TsaB [Candidatus Bipolaricaulota bacterium]|nr:tRNA (adenosine(37)-N6)-threonylcarbamoyltransferase complex dimerization subunit type 1 TsaB [Candidatus Bipolaricaulota bacterium]
MAVGLDTAEEIGSVALVRGSETVSEHTMTERLRHAEQLLPTLVDLLEASGLDKRDIQLVCVNRGPGSFTGLRIGFATGQGLCQSLGVPLVGVDGLESYLLRTTLSGRACIVVHSRRELYYAQWYNDGHSLGPTEMVTRERLIDRIAKRSRPLVVGGSGVTRLRGQLLELARDHLQTGIVPLKLASEDAVMPSASAIGVLGRRLYCKDEILSAEPAYVEPILIKSS